MSLNSAEIDLVLAELDLPGSFVQQVIQSDFRNLYLQVFRPADRFQLRICLQTGSTRLHRSPEAPPKPRVRQRFAQLLHSRIRGAHITGARQVNRDRIVRIDLERSDERTILWLRLWGGAANAIATDCEGLILDAFFRRPARGETSGGRYLPEETPHAPGKAYVPRWTTDINRAVDEHYRAAEEAAERKALVERAERRLSSLAASIARRMEEIDRQIRLVGQADREQTLGDLLMANLHRIDPGSRWVEVDDYTRGDERLVIELDPSLSPGANAERHYEAARKARRRSGRLAEEREGLARQLELAEANLPRLRELEAADLRNLAGADEVSERAPAPAEGRPGLEFHSGGFTILVGRNARESDELLRRAVRGNDLWLHARDHAGGHVFIRSKPGKSVPLDVLLDAGNLAVHFSRARGAGSADLYYTRVKYLRRARGGAPGLVIPTQEKNLSITHDEERMRRLLG